MIRKSRHSSKYSQGHEQEALTSKLNNFRQDCENGRKIVNAERVRTSKFFSMNKREEDSIGFAKLSEKLNLEEGSSLSETQINQLAAKHFVKRCEDKIASVMSSMMADKSKAVVTLNQRR